MTKHIEDPYVYKGTEILVNKLNIKDIKTLEKAEKEITNINMREIRENPIEGNFNYEHLKNIHSYIFKDIYEWAGTQRTINIEKSEIVLNGLMFEYSKIENIEKEIKSSLEILNSINWKGLSIDEKTKKFSKVMSDVWKAHAFREGNTRTTIAFFTQFAEEKEFPLKYELFSDNSKYVRDSLVASAYEDKELNIKRNYTYLEKIIRHAIRDGSIEKGLEKEIKKKKRENSIER